MKEQEVTSSQQALEQEPRAADTPPVFISADEPTSTVVSGQVGQQQRQTLALLLLTTMETLCRVVIQKSDAVPSDGGA